MLSQIYNNKWNALANKWDYEWAISMYDKVLELNPKFAEAYYNKWVTLYDKWDYEWAIYMYDEALKLNPKNTNAYYNKWFALKKLWKQNYRLYKFVSSLLEDWKVSIFNSINIFDKKEKTEIIKLFNKGEFNEIYNYLLNLEE